MNIDSIIDFHFINYTPSIVIMSITIYSSEVYLLRDVLTVGAKKMTITHIEKFAMIFHIS
ncbi:MAG: hypothetical protein COX48_05490 [bacterium (Candidatus Stahlbacteria) CG23_combo_of_CG06-09_8_20_14_all_34_7]|nr:MAG: hypothetical protein COX48_05490 [bacterium (Candidatus Stahlbacteria) CG23_combo_of_CG06-09_8_20_14_all_34_7]